MPVEIKELVLKARVSDETNTQSPESVDPEALRHDILEECLEAIREAIDKQAER